MRLFSNQQLSDSQFRKVLSLITLIFLCCSGKGQIKFSNDEFHLTLKPIQQSTELSCVVKNKLYTFMFIRYSVNIHDHFIETENQLFQIIPVTVYGTTKPLSSFNHLEQKSILGEYSQNEINHLSGEVHVKISEPHNQWVNVGSRYWYIWYFQVEDDQPMLHKKVKFQLNASTVVNDKIITINSPIFSDADFDKSGIIVNQLMTSLSTRNIDEKSK